MCVCVREGGSMFLSCELGYMLLKCFPYYMSVTSPKSGSRKQHSIYLVSDFWGITLRTHLPHCEEAHGKFVCGHCDWQLCLRRVLPHPAPTSKPVGKPFIRWFQPQSVSLCLKIQTARSRDNLSLVELPIHREKRAYVCLCTCLCMHVHVCMPLYKRSYMVMGCECMYLYGHEEVRSWS